MYERMYEIDKVLDFFSNEFSGKYSDERITELYNKIPNPDVRVNSDDKQWVAYATQASEDTTAVNAIRTILIKELSNPNIPTRIEIEIIVDIVGEEFDNLTHKPRIPFYISVLDKFI